MVSFVTFNEFQKSSHTYNFHLSLRTGMPLSEVCINPLRIVQSRINTPMSNLPTKWVSLSESEGQTLSCAKKLIRWYRFDTVVVHGDSYDTVLLHVSRLLKHARVLQSSATSNRYDARACNFSLLFFSFYISFFSNSQVISVSPWNCVINMNQQWSVLDLPFWEADKK